MKQKEVKIIGLSVNQQLGIIKAVKMDFDQEKRIIRFKGGVGNGKSTLKKGLETNILGNKALIDKKLYGNIDTEVQILDGDLNIWIGCKSNKSGGLDYVLYAKDENGKKIKNPVIDGTTATPSKYLQALQTELTWKLNELMSENPTVQKNILLKLYQHEFIKLGVIFDKKSPLYKGSILDKIDKAIDERAVADMMRKQVGGIKEDLISQGFDPERPATCPDFVDIDKLEEKIKEQIKLKTIAETESNSGKDSQLQKILTEASELTNKAIRYNSLLNKEYQELLSEYKRKDEKQHRIQSLIAQINGMISDLDDNGVKADFSHDFKMETLTLPTKPKLIRFDENEKIIISDKFEDKEAQKIIDDILELQQKYIDIVDEKVEVDLSKFDAEITRLETEKEKAKSVNNIVKAIDSWNRWKDKDDAVKKLQKEYYSLLKNINTGVDGLSIISEDDNLFLAYNGVYDPKYFHNEEKEMRKLSSYSGTQQPMIALLIQNYLLNLKSKAMRYMFIDNIPIDKPTEKLLENMCQELNLTIFLNITGDFTESNLEDGDILVQGGELFFK